ncbi:MAG: tetratricopeptide repeat protein [Bryobacterales bacterium]|nr:tetratricopeptide repeat protein [Bryobacterales bacterium]
MSTARSLFSLAALLTVAGSAEHRVVSIGNRWTNNIDHIAPLRYADKDAWKVARAASKWTAHVRPLPDLTSAAALTQLEAVLGAAKFSDTVVLHVSAQGFSLPGQTLGYISTANTVLDKPDSSAIPLWQVSELILRSAVGRVVILADVNRADPETPIPGQRRFLNNQIVLKLNEMARSLQGKAVIYLAADGKPTREQPDLGHGPFSYHLSAAIEKVGVRDFESIRSMWAAPPPPKTLQPARAALEWPPLPLFAFLGGFPPLPLAFQFQSVPPPSLASTRDSTCDGVDPAFCRSRLLLAEAAGTIAAYGTGDQFPNDPEKLTRADFARAIHQIQEARELWPSPIHEGYARYDQALRDKSEVDELFCRGRIQLFDQQFKDARFTLSHARVQFEQLRLRYPELQFRMPEIENALGISFLEDPVDPDLAAAARHFKKAVEISPRWVYARHNLALAFAEAGDYASAAEEYRKSIALMPNYPYLYYNLGLVLHRANRLNDARRAYQDALSSFERAMARFTEVALWCRTEGLEGRADWLERRALLYYRNMAEVRNVLGVLTEPRDAKPGRDRTLALAHYRAALLHDPQHNPARYNLAHLLQRSEEHRLPAATSLDAVALLVEAVSQDPNFNLARLLLGKLYMRTAEWTRARVEFTAAMQASPDGALASLAELENKTGRPDSAIELLRVPIETAVRQGISPDPALRLLLGEAYLQTKMPDRHSLACKEFTAARKTLSPLTLENTRKQIEQRARGCPYS